MSAVGPSRIASSGSLQRKLTVEPHSAGRNLQAARSLSKHWLPL